jgi:hypothetical protein
LIRNQEVIPEEEEIMEQVIPKDHLEPLEITEQVMVLFLIVLAKGNKTCYTMTEHID